MHACSDISYMILTSGFNLREFSHMGKRVVAKLDRKLKTEIRTWLIKFTSVSFDNSESEAGWVYGTHDERQGVPWPWQGSAS